MRRAPRVEHRAQLDDRARASVPATDSFRYEPAVGPVGSTSMLAASDGIPFGVQRLSPSPPVAPASSASIIFSARSQPVVRNAVSA